MSTEDRIRSALDHPAIEIRRIDDDGVVPHAYVRAECTERELRRLVGGDFEFVGGVQTGAGARPRAILRPDTHLLEEQ